jgi:hypothetical protein
MRLISLLLPVAILSAVPSGAATGAQTEPEDRSTVLLPCIPVTTYWFGPVPSEGGTGAPEGMARAPALAVVSIDVRPKDARVLLDERFVGRARYFDGTPDYMYLEPGTYRLELQLGGYRPVVVSLEAAAGCRFDLKHRLERVPDTRVERRGGGEGKGKPMVRVFGPVQPTETMPSGPRNRGPDMSLRPDLSNAATAETMPREDRAALRLTVHPGSARVSIDGKFVATADELSRMEGPLALPVGRHVIEVAGDGFAPVVRELELAAGEELEVELTLGEGGDDAGE